MKLKTTETPIFSGGDLQMKGFQIAASAKAFRILSSNLYKNKIRAIIRELSCNAVDGHIANGNKNPFDVSLPGMLDPQFKIRDYGCGMDHETIMNLYTTYFASTKSESNDYIGALGLGSKSPFSYTDSFTVVSYFDGVRRTYSAFIKDGEPTITKVAEAETKEPNGIEITVPVNSQDCSTWRKEAQYVYSTFGEIRPNIKLDINYIPTTEKVRVKNTVHGSGVFAVMGNIAYPLPKEMWENTFIDIMIRSTNHWNANTDSYYIRFDLGELDITPSREELSLDDETIKNIKNRIKSVDSELGSNLIKEVSEYEDIRKLYADIHKKYNVHYWNHINSNSQYKMKNDVTVKNEYTIRTSFNVPQLKVLIPGTSPARFNSVNVPISRYDLNLASPRAKALASHAMSGIASVSNTKVDLIINDVKTGFIRTMQGLKILNKLHSSYVYTVHADHADDVIKAFKSCWIDSCLNIYYASKCDDARKANPPVKKATSNSKRAPNTVNFTRQGETPVAMYADDIKSLSGYWIPMFNGSFCSTKNRDYVMCSKTAIREFMNAKKIDAIPVIKGSHWEQVAKNKNVSEVWEHVLDFIVSYENKITEDMFPINNRNDSIITRLNKQDSLKFIANKLSNYNPETGIYNLLNEVLSNHGRFYHCSNYTKHEDTLKNMLKKFEEMRKIVSTKSNNVIAEFELKNPLISFYLRRNYGSITQQYVEEIKNTVKL